MKNMNINEAVEFLEKQIEDPKVGLPEEIFLFATRITPMINVDLLIKDENGRTLLSWRDDEDAGTGWHIPGGIIRFKEKIETRIQKVIEKEIGLPVEYKRVPIEINQLICQKVTRGHFISLLFRCFLSNKYILNNDGKKVNERGFLKWHEDCPSNLIKVHDIYRKFLK
jgi:colanic acid biosynthesis protein WcaH